MNRLLVAALLFSSLASGQPIYGHDPFGAVTAAANAKSKAGNYAGAAKDWDAAIAAAPDGGEWLLKAAQEAADTYRIRARWQQAPDAVSHRSLILSLLESKTYVEHAEPGDQRLLAELKRLRKVDPATEPILGGAISVAVDSNDLDDKARSALRDQAITALKQLGLNASAGAAPNKLRLTAKWALGPAKGGIRMPGDDEIPDNAILCRVQTKAKLESDGAPLAFSDEAGSMNVDEGKCRKAALERVGPGLAVGLLRAALAAAASAH